MLASRFEFRQGARSIYPDTDRRIEAIRRMQEKLEQGIYQMEDVGCPCGATDDRVLATRDRFAIPVRNVICRRCGIVRISPRMTEASYARFYAEDYLDLKTLEDYSDGRDRVRGVHASEYEQAARIHDWVTSAPGVDFPAIGTAPKMADVGCGSGGMVRYFNERGFDSSGCDYDIDSIQFGSANGLDVRVGTSSALLNEAPFDLVLLSHVFEHVTDPFSMLDSLIALMRPGGLLYIELPGIRDISMLRYRNDFLRYLRFVHTFSYSLDTLRNIVESHGFELVRGDQWIHAVFRYTGNAPVAMSPLPSEVLGIEQYLATIEVRRHLFPVYRTYRLTRSALGRVVRRRSRPAVGGSVGLETFG